MGTLGRGENEPPPQKHPFSISSIIRLKATSRVLKIHAGAQTTNKISKYCSIKHDAFEVKQKKKKSPKYLCSNLKGKKCTFPMIKVKNEVALHFYCDLQ